MQASVRIHSSQMMWLLQKRHKQYFHSWTLDVRSTGTRSGRFCNYRRVRYVPAHHISSAVSPHTHKHTHTYQVKRINISAKGVLYIFFIAFCFRCSSRCNCDPRHLNIHSNSTQQKRTKTMLKLMEHLTALSSRIRMVMLSFVSSRHLFISLGPNAAASHTFPFWLIFVFSAEHRVLSRNAG